MFWRRCDVSVQRSVIALPSLIADASTTCPHGRLSASSVPRHASLNRYERCSGTYHILLDINDSKVLVSASPCWLQAPLAVPVALRSATASTYWMLVKKHAQMDSDCHIPTTLREVSSFLQPVYSSRVTRKGGLIACSACTKRGQCHLPAGLGESWAVAAGCRRTCAVRADGRLFCFGRNEFGQGTSFGCRSWRLSFLCSAGRWSARLFWMK